MQDVLLWLVAVEVIGLAAFPLCYYLFPRLRDRLARDGMLWVCWPKRSSKGRYRPE